MAGGGSTLGPSWSLRSPASPRCLTAHVVSQATTIDDAGGGQSNPFDDSVGQRRDDNATSDGRCFVHSVTFGTDRGSLHHRRYPPLLEPGDYNGGGSSSRRGARDPSQIVIDPENYSTDSSIDLQGAVKGSIVGIVRAASSTCAVADDSANDATTTPPVYLLLVDDDKGSSASSPPSNAGAYAAHLVTIRHGAFNKLPASPSDVVGGGGKMPGAADSKPPLLAHHRRGGSHGRGGGSSGGSWSGHFGDQQFTSSQNVTSSTTTPSTTAAAGSTC